MKILYTSDLHGRRDFYQEIITLTKWEKINAVVLGGDLFPMQGTVMDSLGIQNHFIENLFYPFLIELKDQADASVYCILGNDDWAATLPLLRQFESDHLVHLLEGQTFQLSDEWIITGYPYVPPTPFSLKDFEKRDLKNDMPVHTTDFPAISQSGSIERIDEAVYFTQQSSIEEDMTLLPRVRNDQKVICVMHAPPYHTALDRMGNGRSTGSKAIRYFIKKEQPAMTLHGHIHESPMVSGFYWQRMGQTLSVNPGQMGAHLSAVIWDLSQPMETLNHTLNGSIQFR